MRKTLFPLIACFSYIAISGQVGINTASPKSTLEITAKNAVGTSTGTDGLLIPRLDRQRALSMTTASIQPSTLIYINDASTGTATGQASNINATGFYYFDGSTTKWTKLITSGDVPNITASNGLTKTGNDVKLGGTLTENTVINGTSVINIPQTNGIAIGSTGQVAGAKLLMEGGALQVGGQLVNFAGGLQVRNQDALKPVATMYSTSNSELFRLNENGNVGIGTNSPSQKLEVAGNVKFNGVPSASSLSGTDEVLALQSDGTAKKVSVQNLVTPSVSKMYFVYYIFTKNGGDFVSNFDTKIPANKYIATVVGFDTNHSSGSFGFKNNSTAFDFNIPDIYTFKEGGTWRIKADVPNGSTTADINFSWGVRVLVISNEQASDLGTRSFNLGTGTTGADVVSPVP